ncbi:hypothetical protein PAXINDRAFT_21881 [Paxillus involutus ATCC 200175]|uniref:Transmembrane protein n=2 Tax=Paxillus involutus ATCC 200175 TaxID=664439 RepID=A0A0C9TC38_PAXIN|nr:hypothetical protein PAXINDRAFT_21881 [Paxillus involutus ATCC 200175]
MQTLPLPASPVFNVSTGGIFPAALTNWTYFMTNATASVVGVGSNASYPRGLLSNYTILQQGFTVDVACQTQDFSDIGPGFPSMTLFNASLPLPPLGQTQSNFSTPLVAWAWTTNYVGSILVSNASGTQVIAGAVCPFQDFVGPSNQSALVLWQDVDRSYQDVSLVCEVTPFITTVRVQYSGTVVNVSDVVTKTRLSADGTNWPLLSVPAQTLATILYLSQGMYDNSLMSNIQFTESELGQTNLNVTAALGNYFRGMVEYWGTMHRTLLYFTQEDIPDEMMIPMNGTMVITTMGWKYNASTHSFALVPISIVMALTMCAVAMTYWEKRKVRRSLEFPQSFNPSNPLHIILASRRGALYQAPSGHDRTEDESLQVHLEVRDGMAVLTSEGPGDVDEGKGPSGPLGDFSVAENVQTTPSKV